MRQAVEQAVESDTPVEATDPRRPLGAAERRLLLAVLDPAASLSALRFDAFDWSALIQVARSAKVLPLLADRVLAEPTLPVDEPTRSRLRDALFETAVYNTRLIGELARTAAVLDAAGVDHLALKGAVLMLDHYARPGMRHAVDIDLVIDPERFDEGLAALRAAGFTDAEQGERIGPDGGVHAHTPEAVEHACAPLRGPSGVNVDLHHRVPTSGFERSGGFRGWHARGHRVDVQGQGVRLCAPHDLLVHLCEHFVMQNYADPIDAPRLLADIQAAFPEGPPWSVASRGPLAQRVAVSTCRALHRAAFHVHSDADPLSALLQRVAVADPSVRLPLAQVANMRGHARRIYLDLVHRPGYALRTWFPTRAYLGERYGVDPGSWRVYPLYVSRLVRAATKPLWPR